VVYSKHWFTSSTYVFFISDINNENHSQTCWYKLHPPPPPCFSCSPFVKTRVQYRLKKVNQGLTHDGWWWWWWWWGWRRVQYSIWCVNFCHKITSVHWKGYTTMLSTIHTNMLRTCCLAVSGDDKHRKMLSLFYERQQQELDLSKNSFFFTNFKPPSKSLGKKFLASCDNSYRKCTWFV